MAELYFIPLGEEKGMPKGRGGAVAKNSPWLTTFLEVTVPATASEALLKFWLSNHTLCSKKHTAAESPFSSFVLCSLTLTDLFHSEPNEQQTSVFLSSALAERS